MPPSGLFGPFLLAALPLIGGQQATAPAGHADVIAVHRDDADRMTVPVRIAARGPYRFLIDTGSQNTVVSTALAQALALPTDKKATLVGVAGTQEVDTVHLDEIALGRRSYYSLLAPLLNRDNIGADGILGLDSLQGQRMVIDFRKQLIAVDDARALGGDNGYDIVVTARRRSGQLIVTDATLDGVRVNVVIDTGAETSIGNPALAEALARRHHPGGTQVLRSVTGQEITASIGFGRSLQIDRVTFANVQIAYADSPAFHTLGFDKKPALFLGMRDLRSLNRIAVDFAQRKILFELPAGAFG